MQAVVVTSTALDLNDANLHLLLQHIDLVLLFDQLLLLSANLKDTDSSDNNNIT